MELELGQPTSREYCYRCRPINPRTGEQYTDKEYDKIVKAMGSLYRLP